MNSKPIGVFDTGAGGLCMVRELRRLMPRENIVYLSDTANAPCGGHSRELVAANAMRGLLHLQRQDVKLLVSASGTVSAVLPDAALKKLETPFIGTLLPSAQEACATSVTGVIGVIGTTAAIRSSAFGRAIRNIRTDARVIGKACPLFLPLVEAGAVRADDPLLRLAVGQYTAPLMKEGVDTLILGSTHFSPLFTAVSEALGYSVTLVDAAVVAARYVQSYLLQNGLQNEGEAGPPAWYVTDAPQDFREASRVYYGSEIQENVLQVSL